MSLKRSTQDVFMPQNSEHFDDVGNLQLAPPILDLPYLLYLFSVVITYHHVTTRFLFLRDLMAGLRKQSTQIMYNTTGLL